MAIVAIFALVFIYAASFAIRITHGISKTVDSPEYTIRLQILNGCGVDGAAARVARSIDKLVKLPLEVTVIEVDDFNSYQVAKSFLIARENDKHPVEILADQLGLDNDITYEPVENNYRAITATLIIGGDYENIIELTSK